MGFLGGRRLRCIAALAPLSLLVACGGASSGSPAAPTPVGTASIPVGTAPTPVGTAAPSVTFGAGTGSSTPAVVGSTLAGVTGDRPDSLPVAEASAASPLPEVVVRHLQTETWVQLKNALPADRPLLVWFWAPH